MTESHYHALKGLEPDNLLAFLALLGLLRSLDTSDRDQAEAEKLRPRVSWNTNESPLRPKLHVAKAASQACVTEAVAHGLRVHGQILATEGLRRSDLDFTRKESFELLSQVSETANCRVHDEADVFSSLMTDAAVKESKEYATSPVDPTPFCLLFGQGHQHFSSTLCGGPQRCESARARRTQK
jgi:hypothetical protein